MINPSRGFPECEFNQRVQRAQTLMKVTQHDALLLTTKSEFQYFTGFLTNFWNSPTRPWFLVIPQSAPPIAVIPSIGVPLMQKTGLKNIYAWDSPCPKDDGISLLASVLQEQIGISAKIGVPMAAETILRMPQNDFVRLKNKYNKASFIDATDVVRQTRFIKSEAEIEKIRYICHVANQAFDETFSHIKAQQTLIEIFRAFKISLLKNGADDVPYLAGAASHAGYGDVIAPPTEYALKEKDILMLDTGAVFDGYFCDFDRNLAIGSVAPPASLRAHQVLYDATQAALDAVCVGMRCCDLHQIMQAVIVKEGYLASNVGRFGHGLGIDLTEPPSLSAHDLTPIEAGMVLTLEPSLSISDGIGMVHEENIVIRENGAELLSSRVLPTLPCSQ